MASSTSVWAQPASSPPAAPPPANPQLAAEPEPQDIPLAPPSSSAPSYANIVPGRALPPPPPAEPLYREHDYRWQMILSDVAAVGLIGTASKPGVGLGLLAYALGGPIIQDLNDGGGRAGASFALRLGAPLVGALALGGLAALSDNCKQDDFDCGADVGLGAAVGLLLGAAAAVVIDDLIIARPRKIYSRAISMTANVDRDRASFGLAGRF